eukprot:5956597-Pyramimonas_sp.AAC.1
MPFLSCQKASCHFVYVVACARDASRLVDFILLTLSQVVVFQDSVDGQQMFRQASHSCYVDMLICLLLQSRSLAECLLTWTGHHNVLL